ncbi:hypothetical protein DUNSADRAFT_4522 [Dunaliella salina]|uniref:Encoded protein n=1 Tax=Dunaliella salina TaxID=3046 RepID=A0ABQ7GRS7_DUNSA|nr:hypothetical protein DUNSADRAFT_4522 [Dunaliella salina]|eukprot:KAF5837314.1 hypothetical protein DUNSADRAFT_4522 [Dunaliella salina]
MIVRGGGQPWGQEFQVAVSCTNHGASLDHFGRTQPMLGHRAVIIRHQSSLNGPLAKQDLTIGTHNGDDALVPLTVEEAQCS